jgi:hypothetical protein
MNRNDRVNSANPTGRSSQFYTPLDDETDAEAIAQRVKQQCLVALERGEADAVQVTVQEATTGGE